MLPSTVQSDESIYVVRPPIVGDNLDPVAAAYAATRGSFHPKLIVLETEDFLRVIITDENVSDSTPSMWHHYGVHDFERLQDGAVAPCCCAQSHMLKFFVWNILSTPVFGDTTPGALRRDLAHLWVGGFTQEEGLVRGAIVDKFDLRFPIGVALFTSYPMYDVWPGHLNAGSTGLEQALLSLTVGDAAHGGAVLVLPEGHRLIVEHYAPSCWPGRDAMTFKQLRLAFENGFALKSRATYLRTDYRVLWPSKRKVSESARGSSTLYLGEFQKSSPAWDFFCDVVQRYPARGCWHAHSKFASIFGMDAVENKTTLAVVFGSHNISAAAYGNLVSVGKSKADTTTAVRQVAVTYAYELSLIMAPQDDTARRNLDAIRLYDAGARYSETTELRHFRSGPS